MSRVGARVLLRAAGALLTVAFLSAFPAAAAAAASPMHPAAPEGLVPCPDLDADGYAVCSEACELPDGKTCGDCDDASSGVFPGAPEACNDLDDATEDLAKDLLRQVAPPHPKEQDP